MKDYSFGNFLYMLRRKQGLSQYQLARLVGVSDKAVSKWECGASKPKSHILIDLCDVLDISVDELLAGKYFDSEKKTDKKDMLWKKAHSKLRDKYGENPDIRILDRYLAEFDILRNTDLILYFDYLSGVLAMASESKEYVRIKGELPSSFVAFVMGASDINSLKSHYYCPSCKKVEFDFLVNCGWDLPGKTCDCGDKYIRDGFDIPISSVIDSAYKTPTIMLTVSNGFMGAIEQFTINYFTNSKVKSVITPNCTGIKKFIIINSGKNYAADEEKTLKYPSIVIAESKEFDALKALKVRTSVIPDMNTVANENIVSQFTLGHVGGIPEFRREFFKDMTTLTQVRCFYDLIQLAGLSHSTGLWTDNEENIVKRDESLLNIISYKEDVFRVIRQKLLLNGITDLGYANKVARDTSVGVYAKGMRESMEKDLHSLGMSDSFCTSLCKIHYLFPKAVGVSYVKYASLLMWYKINYPNEFKEFTND